MRTKTRTMKISLSQDLCIKFIHLYIRPSYAGRYSRSIGILEPGFLPDHGCVTSWGCGDHGNITMIKGPLRKVISNLWLSGERLRCLAHCIARIDLAQAQEHLLPRRLQGCRNAGLEARYKTTILCDLTFGVGSKDGEPQHCMTRA